MYLRKAKGILWLLLKKFHSQLLSKHLYFEVLSNTVYSNQTRMRGGECASPLEMFAQCLCFVELVIIIAYEHLFTNEVQTLKCTCELFFAKELNAQFPKFET